MQWLMLVARGSYVNCPLRGWLPQCGETDVHDAVTNPAWTTMLLTALPPTPGHTAAVSDVAHQSLLATYDAQNPQALPDGASAKVDHT